MDVGKHRNEIHLPRRLFHLLSGVLIVAIAYSMDSKKTIVMSLVLLTSVMLAFELVRLAWPRVNRGFLRLLKPLLRKGEEFQISASTHYCLGCTLSAIVFPRTIAFLSILYLAFGDPIASIVGVKYGRHFLNRHFTAASKSIEGSAACFFFCVLLTLGFSFLMPITKDLPVFDRFLFSCLGGLGAAIGEVLPLRTDDNLALPLLSGAFLWLTSTVLNLIPGLYF